VAIRNSTCLFLVDLVYRHGLRTTYFVGSELVSPHSSKNDECYMCSTLASLQGFENDLYFICSELVSLYGLKNDECYLCNSLVSPHDFKNDVYFMYSALVWPRGLKNDECYMRMASERRIFHV